MSVDVLREVFRLSQSRGVARNVLTVLADAAHPDGVTWLPIDPPKGGDPSRCITHRANASRRAVIDAVASLVAAGEIEVRQAQRGRARINVYRVVLGSVGVSAVDYSDLPFELEQPFGRLGADSAPSLKVVTGGDGVQSPQRRGADSGGDWVQISSEPEPAQSSIGSGIAATSATPEASREPSLEAAAVPPNGSNVSLDEGDRGDPAAAEVPASDREVEEIVAGLRGADPESPKRIASLAFGLPRSVFLDAVATTRARKPSNACGLLTHLLKVARAERAAAFSAALAARAQRPVHVPAPWSPDEVKRDAPELYVRQLARILDDGDLTAALTPFTTPEQLDRLLELGRQVRAGREPEAERETPEQARLRWVATRAADAGFPLDEVHLVIDGWADVDQVERDELHEMADKARRRASAAADAA